MNWQDEGILVLKRKYSENANIVSLLTQNHGKISGIVYGITKIKSIQIEINFCNLKLKMKIE